MRSITKKAHNIQWTAKRAAAEFKRYISKKSTIDYKKELQVSNSSESVTLNTRQANLQNNLSISVERVW